MALQGTLDTFELPDVLRLLASTGKTGRLGLDSDRGVGDVWLAEGKVVGVDAPGAPDDLGDALFDLLRSREGSFAFEPGAEPASWRAPVAVEPLLEQAEARLAEWRAIEAVVPSLAAWVTLVPALPAAEVTVDADTWGLIAAVGGGVTVGELRDLLELSEIEACRLVRDVAELGLVEVGDPPAHIARGPAATPEPASVEPAPAEPALPVGEPVAVAADDDPVPVWDDPIEVPEVVEAVEVAEVVDDVERDDALARQLAMLSPRAAEAVAAAAAAAPDDDDAPVDDVPHDDEPVNRSLLLKFLGSVKS
jgi:hypothetical protein